MIFPRIIVGLEVNQVPELSENEEEKTIFCTVFEVGWGILFTMK